MKKFKVLCSNKEQNGNIKSLKVETKNDSEIMSKKDVIEHILVFGNIFITESGSEVKVFKEKWLRTDKNNVESDNLDVNICK
jgi:hypothetical protein